MRVSLRGLADLTNVNSMLLPDFGPNLPGPTQYQGGITGLGQVTASCPSAEQLAGTQDCSDPCQASLPPCVPAGTTTGAAANALATAASLTACQAAGGIWNANGTCSPGPSVPLVAGISNQTLLLIGGGFLAFVLILMAAKR